MTFNNAPWAIDGARSTSALARLATYATGGGRSGIVKPDDLKVLPLAVPGNGLRITSGAAIILNHYLSDPDEVYAVANPGTHTVDSSSMPAASGSTAYYLVCVVVGDPEFNQAGHPFMPAGPITPPEDAPDYEYVRVVIVPCTAGTTRFEQLGLSYPAYALARLEVPPSTTTITSEMIINLRELSQPRQERALLVGQPSEGSGTVNSASLVQLGSFAPSIEIPPWATWADVVGRIDGLSHLDPEFVGALYVEFRGLNSAPMVLEFADTAAAGERFSASVGWAESVAAQAGTVVQVRLMANRASGAGSLQIYNGTIVVFDIQFSERAIA